MNQKRILKRPWRIIIMEMLSVTKFQAEKSSRMSVVYEQMNGLIYEKGPIRWRCFC